MFTSIIVVNCLLWWCFGTSVYFYSNWSAKLHGHHPEWAINFARAELLSRDWCHALAPKAANVHSSCLSLAACRISFRVNSAWRSEKANVNEVGTLFRNTVRTAYKAHNSAMFPIQSFSDIVTLFGPEKFVMPMSQ